MAPTLPGAPPLSEQEHRDAFAIWSAAAAPKLPLAASVAVFAHELLFLRVDRDYRCASGLIRLDPVVDELELRVAVGVVGAFEGLAVIVLTSSREDEDILNSYSLGANAYVRKPVDFSQFTEAVKTLGLFWLLLNESPPPRASAT